MSRSFLAILFAGLVLPLADVDLEAVTPRRQQLLDRTSVERGTARGIAVRDAVGLRLAPRIREIPLQYLLVETDAAAVGELEGPAAVTAVVRKIAAIKGASTEELATATTANLKRFLQK